MDQENVKNVVKGKSTTLGGPKRTALRDVSANTKAFNIPKEVVKKEPFVKPAQVALKSK